MVGRGGSHNEIDPSDVWMHACRVLCVKMGENIVATGSSDHTIRYTCTYIGTTHGNCAVCLFVYVNPVFCVLSEFGVWRVASAYKSSMDIL